MAEKHWTKEQSQAIEARGGTLLVSAAAGSGKTAVLVERVIRLITGDTPCDADRLLVVTFTNAAAAEMKERISLRLSELIAADPLDSNLQRQQILLQNAHISTIHAFCLNLIKENFETLNIPPDFRIADENEIKVMRGEVLTELLEEKYAAEMKNGAHGAFLTLSGMLGAGRDDSMLTDTILRLYDFVVSLPDPEGWLDAKLLMYNHSLPLTQTPWGKSALDYLARVLAGADSALRDSLATMGMYEQLQAAYAPAYESDRRKIAAALSAVQSGEWDSVYQIIAGFTFDRLGSVRKFEPESVKDAVKARRDDVKAMIEKLRKGILCCDEAGFRADIDYLHPLVTSLFDAVIELDKRFLVKKLEKNLLDFSDLERYALRLLTDSNEGNLTPTPTAKAISQRFEEVLVDEYQDTNPTQDAIFQAVSGNGQKLFMVGDVKQSIYRFRRATPELFIDKQEHFTPFEEGAFPAKIILGRNFRSRQGVTDAVNFIFRQLMSKEFGEIDYGVEEELIPCAAYPPHDCPDFSLQIVDTSGYDDNDGKEAIEARHIAAYIRKLVREKYLVNGEHGPRPVKWSDFLILLRSTSTRAEKYKRELMEMSVPVYADVAGGYLSSYEVAVMLSLLRILDNPLQDVPLLSVLLSPIFGFTPDDLAAVRIHNRKGSLYLALCSYAKENGGRFSEFVDTLDSLRGLAAVLPADRLILRIFERTGFLSICEAMPSGEARRANLRLLLDYARGYEAAGYKGLAGFLRFIDRIGEQEGDLAPASAVSENADVVRIMSIHKSKGLEYPVCILAGCTNRFNRDDLLRLALFHPFYGFASIVRDEKMNCRYTTLPREVVRLETERSALSEEMRILYVAMTRAREKLVCVMTLPNPESTVKKAAGFLSDGLKLDPLTASQAMNFAEWLIACSLRHPDCGALRKLAGMDGEALLDCTSRWDVVITEAQSNQQPVQMDEATLAEPDEADSTILAEIHKRLSFVYPYIPLSGVPSKVAVSELAEKNAVNDHAFTEAEPAFMTRTHLSPAQKGTALHMFMQYAHLRIKMTSADIEQEIERLVAQRFLLPDEGEAIDRQKVMGYLQSEIFRRICAASHVYREFRFNIEEDASMITEIDKTAGNETIVLQGMADVVFADDTGLYILDYKTDHAGGDELRRRYTRQLEIYARAVSQVMRRDVTAKYIYGFAEQKLIEV